MLLNEWSPDLGIILLGVYTSTLTALPIYIVEFLLRITARNPIVIIEDINWYTGRHRKYKLKRKFLGFFIP